MPGTEGNPDGKDGGYMEARKLKTRLKTAFTKSKNRLLNAVTIDSDEEDINVKEVRQLQRDFDDKLDDVMSAMEALGKVLPPEEPENEEKLAKEMETIDCEYSATLKTVQKIVDRSRNGEHSDKKDLGSDMWKQMKRVSIPTFDGDKRKYEGWKSAFMACIDKAPATPEYKLLQLRQYLSGEALKTIENLGHSAVSYDAAKQRLERKFGGQRRQVAMYLEELENFPLIKEENAKSIEKFADLIDIAVINLKEAGRKEDLGDGVLYIRLQKKLPEAMLTRYHRWIHENDETESVESLQEWIIEESTFRTTAAETVHGVSDGRKRISSTHFGSHSTPGRISNTSRPHGCKLCNGKHGIWKCELFKQLKIAERWEKAKCYNLCFRCLSDSHHGQKCKYSRACGINGCTKSHHRLLHNAKTAAENVQSPLSNSDASNGGAGVHTHTSHEVTKKYVCLRTVPVIIQNGEKEVVVNALLDDGSTQTYLNLSVAAELGIPHNQNDSVTVNVLGGRKETFSTSPVEFGLKSMNSQIKLNMVAQTVDRVAGNLEVTEINRHSSKWEHLKGIEFPCVGRKSKIDILIGLDYADLHQSLYEVRGKPGDPIARLTPLGWTCVGNVCGGGSSASFHTFFQNREACELDTTLKRFWEIEECEIDSVSLSQEDKLVLEKSKNSIECNSDNHYTIGMPWKQNKTLLQNNIDMATQRLGNTEKRLLKNPELHQTYSETLERYQERGYVTKVTDIESNPAKWYIPHFPVIKPDKDTTKVRIVFDASAKSNGISLNDAIYQGPALQADLFNVLTRFRRHSVAVVCDIQEMYLQIGIPEPDRCYHRFLWRSGIDSAIEEYEFNRVVFGVNASPFLAQFVSQHNARKHADEYPLAAQTVLHSTYMDDSMDSVPDVESGKRLCGELSELWKKAGMYARKWLSNSSSVLEDIPQKDRAKEVDLSANELPSVKTLGVLWKAESDTFSFKYTSVDSDIQFTKRSFLSKVATLYDPLGFLTPLTVRAKMLLQDIWIAGVEWDSILDESLMSQAHEWFGELQKLENVEIKRSLELNEHDESQIHTFVDASEKAYCAVVYVRNIDNAKDSVDTNFVAAKSKVTPLKSTSVPRLELMAAVLGLRLTQSVCKTLSMNINSAVFWSDSLNVLWWVRNQSRKFKPFVANRLGEIQSVTNPQQWRHVPTEVNPADMGSRGITVDSLSESRAWWHGPDFLNKSSDEWPENKCQPIHTDTEMKGKHKSVEIETFVSTKELPDRADDRLDVSNFSSWTRMVRVYAWVKRFIDNCSVPKGSRNEHAELQVSEIDDAEKYFIHQAQLNAFREEYVALRKGQSIAKSSKLLPLNPKIDDDGIIRCDSRLKYIDSLSYEARCPIILPRKHRVTRLIVQNFHEKGNHSGTNSTLAALSAQYWIIAAREEIRETEHDCLICKRRKVKSSEQIMGPVPSFRVGKTMRAFNQTAVDYAGPFHTKQGRGKTRFKRYLCLFTCMMSRAVHLEIAYGLDTDSFLNAFYRFVSRRGLPETVVSDNGTNFVGAVRELKELYEKLDRNKVEKTAANHGVKWFFNPPASPHFGGIHESMIKSAKRAVYAILENADVNDEELLTAFVAAEGLINSRPLTYQSTNPSDDCVLTPNHFLHGQLGGNFAPESVDVASFDIRKRWRRVQELVQHFWRRWLREYIPTLGTRKKWQHTSRDFEIGDVVAVIDPGIGRGKWTLGRVTAVHPGQDGHVRVVDIRTGNTTLRRAITRVCLLEPQRAVD